MSLKVVAALTILALAQAYPVKDPLILLELSPQEAQQYMRQAPLSKPVLAARTAQLPLVKWNDPKFRDAQVGPLEGHYWRNGYEIENTNDYLEDVYEASQYHGQDGLGAAAFGYSAPESSRVENIEANGHVTGSYAYKDALNNLIEVKYWADDEGFHQEDNIDRSPVTDTPEVREAREAHERAWAEAAALAKANPDPSGEYDPSKYEAEASEPEPVYQSKPKRQTPKRTKEEEEENGPPRGFFYSFDYPVSILVPKNQKNPAGQGQVVDYDTVAINAQSSNLRANQRPAEIHDAQVPPFRRI